MFDSALVDAKVISSGKNRHTVIKSFKDLTMATKTGLKKVDKNKKAVEAYRRIRNEVCNVNETFLNVNISFRVDEDKYGVFLDDNLKINAASYNNKPGIQLPVPWTIDGTKYFAIFTDGSFSKDVAGFGIVSCGGELTHARKFQQRVYGKQTAGRGELQAIEFFLLHTEVSQEVTNFVFFSDSLTTVRMMNKMINNSCSNTEISSSDNASIWRRIRNALIERKVRSKEVEKLFFEHTYAHLDANFSIQRRKKALILKNQNDCPDLVLKFDNGNNKMT